MNYLEKAHELGEMLKNSEEYAKYFEASKIQAEDADAQLLLMNFSKKREELMQKASKENITEAEMNELKNQLEAEYEKINANQNVSNFLDASNTFNEMMQQVSTIITSYVYPNESNCSGDCGSCGGCN